MLIHILKRVSKYAAAKMQYSRPNLGPSVSQAGNKNCFAFDLCSLLDFKDHLVAYLVQFEHVSYSDEL